MDFSVNIKNQLENIYIFDFDGTLFRNDLLILYLIHHFFVFNDKIFLIKSFISLKDKKISSLRKKFFLKFSAKYELRTCFTKFSKSFYIKFFLRKKLFKFFKEIKKNNETIFIVTANYQDLVKVFLEEMTYTRAPTLKLLVPSCQKKINLPMKKYLREK